MRNVLLIIASFCSLLSAFGQSYTVSTIAGTDTLRDGGQATSTLLQRPVAVDVDAAGNLYIADSTANRVRKVTPTGIVTTIAGTGRGSYSGDGGPAILAELYAPSSLVVDRKNGILYIGDYYNNVVRRLQLSTGIITTIAGNGGYRASGDGGPATQAGFDPYGLAVDSSGNLYIADYSNDRVRKVTISTNIITTVAGSGQTGYSGDNGPATSATLDGPRGVAVDSNNNIYIADFYNNAIRRVTSTDGRINSYAGNGDLDLYGDNGAADKAAVPLPETIAIDPTGTQLYILQVGIIRAVNLQSNVISTLGGSLDVGFKGDGGPVAGAMFAAPLDIHFAPNGDVYIADTSNYRVRKIAGGVVTTVAGSDVKDNQAATSAYLNAPTSVGVSANGDLIISDTYNQRVRRVGSDGKIVTISGDGIPGSTAARVSLPAGVAFDQQGLLMFCDSGNDRIRTISPTGGISTYAGGRTGFAGDGGLASAAQFDMPNDIKFDAAGNLYIADSANGRVRKVDAKTGIISTIGGNGRTGLSGIGGPATSAPMTPVTITPDAAGNVYVADTPNHRILKIEAATGNVVLVAGTGGRGFSGDGGDAKSAKLALPGCARLDAAGNLYICDTGNAAVRKVTPSGIITTIAGNGNYQFDKDSGAALSVALVPVDAWVTANGQIYLADIINNRVRKLTPQTAAAMVITAGNNQKGNPGAQIALTVKVADSAAVAVAGIPVTFAVTTGAATLSASTATTAADGTASVTTTLGATAGPVTVTASASGVASVSFSLTVNQVITILEPLINQGGVLGAGLSTPAQRTVAVNGIASVFGSNFAPPGTAVQVGDGDLVNGKVPTTLAGACVTVGGVKAPIFLVYPGQINFQIPTVTAGPAAVQVTSSCGLANELKSNTDSITVQASAPEFFYLKPNTGGRNPIAARDAVSGAVIGAADLFPGGGTAPAQPGEYVALYATSFGATNPAINPGDIPPAGLAKVTGSLKLTFGGRTIADAGILYAGIAPGFPGLYQLNFQVPTDMPEGDQAVVLTIGGASSPLGPFITVKGTAAQ